MKTIIRPDMAPRPNRALAKNPVNTAGDRFGGAPQLWSAALSDIPVGDVQNLNLKTLQPGFRTPYWIDEIRATASIVYPWVANPLPNFSGLAGFLEAKWSTGHFAFSRDFVPLGLHAPRWFRGSAGETIAGSTTSRRAFMSMRWPLPKPLYMPAGDAVQGLIRYRNYASLAAAGLSVERLNISFAGRIAAPGTRAPDVRCVPWLSSFRKASSTVLAQTNDEFRNPFADKPLFVQRFTMRTFAEQLASGALDDQFTETTSYQGTTPAGVYAGVQMEDSLGYKIARGYPPVNDVFDGTRGAWTFSRTLGPREQFDVQLQSFGTVPTAGLTYWTMVGMVGFREEGLT